MTSPYFPQDEGARQPRFDGIGPSPTSSSARPLKPGTMELAPADVNGVFSSAFSTLRGNPAASFGAAILPILLVGFAAVVAVLVFLAVLADDLPSLDGDDWSWPDSVAAGTIVSLVLVGMLLALLAALASCLMTAALVHVFAQGVLGRKATLASSLRIGVRRMWQVFATCALGGIVVLGAPLVIFVIAALASAESEATAALIAILGVLALVPLVVTVYIRTLFAPSAVVIERLGPIDALKRSWSLTRGRFWRTFGVTLLVGIITSSLSGVVSSFTDWVTPDIHSTRSLGITTMTATLVIAVITAVVNAVCQAVVIFASTALYLDACMRTEDLAAALAVATGCSTQISGEPVRLAPGELAFPSSPTWVARTRGSISRSAAAADRRRR